MLWEVKKLVGMHPTALEPQRVGTQGQLSINGIAESNQAKTQGQARSRHMIGKIA